MPRDVLAHTFSLAHVSKNPATFDPKKLDWINKQYLSNMSDEEFAKTVVEPELVKAGLEKRADFEKNASRYLIMAAITKPRVRVAPDVVGLLHFLYTGPTPSIEEKAIRKGLASGGAEASLLEALEVLRGATSWTPEEIDTALHPCPERIGVSNKVFFGALRAAATGSLVSPPLAESIALLGKDLFLARLDLAVDVMKGVYREAW